MMDDKSAYITYVSDKEKIKAILNDTIDKVLYFEHIPIEIEWLIRDVELYVNYWT